MAKMPFLDHATGSECNESTHSSELKTVFHNDNFDHYLDLVLDCITCELCRNVKKLKECRKAWHIPRHFASIFAIRQIENLRSGGACENIRAKAAPHDEAGSRREVNSQ